MLLVLLTLTLLACDGPSTASFIFDATESDISQVEVVEGFNASLPCAIHSPPQDEPVLTLWYFGLDDAPVYSYDQRSGRKPEIWSDARRIGNRAVYFAHEYPPVLLLYNVTRADARTYRCRVDYNFSNSKLALAQLTVVVPPSTIHLRVTKDPVEEGQSNDVVCSGSGGSPSPRVVWIQDGNIVDTKSSERKNVTYNSLDVPASRRDKYFPFTCRVSNNDATVPLSTTFTRNVTAGPLSVKIFLEEEPLVAGRRARLVCEVKDCNPQPRVRWFRDAEQLSSSSSVIRHTKKVTLSTLELSISEADHGSKLTCRAENPLLPTATLEDIYVLNVSYKPNVSLALGWSLKPQDLKEGNDAFFECRVDANPPPYKVTWIHENRELEQNVSAGILASESTLALQRIGRWQSGVYQCKASNVEGDSISNFVNISIKYTPRCVVAPSLRGVALYEPTRIRCAVDANPVNVSFRWTFNNSARKDASEAVSEKKFTTNGLESVLSYTPLSERDYGTLLCFATNAVGTQESPCSFTVISAGPPEEVTDCLVENITSHSAGVSCQAGFDGGLPQRFLLQVFEEESARLVLNISNAKPSFMTHTLEPGITYKALVLTYNSRGSADPVELQFFTLKEVAMHKSLPSMVEPSPIVWVMGVVGGVLLVVGAMLFAVWWVRARDRRSTGIGANTKTVTHIVNKDNNPDLLSMDNADNSDDDPPPQNECELLAGATDVIGATALAIERDAISDEGTVGRRRFGMNREEESRRMNGSLPRRQYSGSSEPQSVVGYRPVVHSYGMFDTDPSSLFVPASPDVNERTHLTAASASPATSSCRSRLAFEDSLCASSDPLAGGSSLGAIGGGSVGGIGCSLLRAPKGRMGERNTAKELDHRRQTTVRLLRSGSPESAC